MLPKIPRQGVLGGLWRIRGLSFGSSRETLRSSSPFIQGLAGQRCRFPVESKPSLESQTRPHFSDRRVNGVDSASAWCFCVYIPSINVCARARRWRYIGLRVLAKKSPKSFSRRGRSTCAYCFCREEKTQRSRAFGTEFQWGQSMFPVPQQSVHPSIAAMR